MYRCLIYVDLLLLIITDVSANTFYFSIHPDNATVEEGKPVHLLCKTEPSDGIAYWWQKSGKHLAMDGRRTILENSNLHIFHADRDLDPGRYQCVAEKTDTKFTTSSHEASVEVHWLSPTATIELVKPASLNDIKKGTNVVLKCSAPANPPLTKKNIEWYFGAQELMLSNKLKVDETGLLHINSFAEEDNGFFHCRVQHNAGILTSKPLIIDINNPDLAKTETVYYVKENSGVKLFCPFEGITSWRVLKDLGELMEVLDSQGNIKVNGREVNISSATRINNNIYVCEKADPSLILLFFFKVEIAIKPEISRSMISPPLPQGRTFYIVKEDQPLDIRFYMNFTPIKRNDLVPNPLPTIQWIDNNNQIISNNLNERVHVVNGRHLRIKKTRRSDVGIYKLKVANMAGEDSLDFNVDIAYPPKFNNDNDLNPTVVVDESETIEMSCNVIDYPRSSYIGWKKDDSELEFTNRIKRLNNGKLISISRADKSDAGVYQCFVKVDFIGDVSSQVKINLEIKEKLQFMDFKTSVLLQVNRPAQLTCHAKGFGEKQYSWMRVLDNGKLTPVKPPMRVKDSSLYIEPGASKEIEGKYRCSVVSNYNKQSINDTVQVTVGEMPEILSQSSNQTVREADRLMLNCSVVGDPVPQVGWVSHKGKRSYDVNVLNTRWRVYANGSLEIRRLRLDDDSTYYCVASLKPFNILKTDKGVTVNVLNDIEYNRKFQIGFSSNMIRTIVIVSGFASAYLICIILLAVFCHRRMGDNRKKRNAREFQVSNMGLHQQGLLQNHHSLPSGSESHHHMMDGGGKVPPPTPMECMSFLSGYSSGTASNYNFHPPLADATTMSTPYSSLHNKLTKIRKTDLKKESTIGDGYFGRIVCGKYNATSVMIKYLNTQADGPRIAEFNRQLIFFGNYEHPNFSKLLGGGQDFFVLEYGDIDLKSYLRNNQETLTISHKTYICYQIVDTMRYLESCNVVHRDLKSRNCSIDSNMRVIVGHMGNCTPYQEEYYDNLPIRWMAPESLFNGVYTTHTDVWAFGVLVWEIYNAAYLPYQPLSNAAVIQAAKEGALDLAYRVDAVYPKFTFMVDNFMRRCFHQNFMERPTFFQLFEFFRTNSEQLANRI